MAAFILGWGFQLIGHRYEGNKPKFLTNMVYHSEQAADLTLPRSTRK